MSDGFVPPPPPYEVSQREFDQKTSRALQTSQQAYDEAWEDWNDAIYEANRNALANGKSVEKHQPSIAPLRVAKKSPQSPTFPSNSHGGPSASSRHVMPPEEEEDHSAPPPPFTPHGPSLDGPPFEEVVLAYRGSRSTSPPLASPISSTPQYSRPLPTPRRPAARRPVTSYAPPTKNAQRIMGPRLEFNPLMAYSKFGQDSPGNEDISPAHNVFNAASFYNSAVSAHLTSPNTSVSPHRPMGHGRSQSQYTYAELPRPYQDHGPYDPRF